MKNRKERMRVVHEACFSAMEAFLREHGHSDVPKGMFVMDRDLRHWWAGMRGSLADGKLTDANRGALLELGELGADLRTDPVIKEERTRKVRENISLGEIERHTPVINAIRTFGAQNGHTRIPPLWTTRNQGLPFGMQANAWRRAHADERLNKWLVTQLEGIEQWSWEVYDPRRLHNIVVPEDTTVMDRPGLRQYLPD